MTDSFAIVQVTRHGLVARHTTGHMLLVTRDVEHDSVTTSTRLFDRDEARRAISFVASVSGCRMATWASLGARMRTYERRSSTNDRGFLDGLTTSANNVVEVRLQAAIASSLVTRLLAKVLATSQTLVTSHSAYVEAIRVGNIVVRGATAGRTLVLSAGLLSSTYTLTHERSSDSLLVGEDFVAFHRFGGGVAATGHLDFDLARTARTWMARFRTPMSAFTHFVASRFA